MVNNEVWSVEYQIYRLKKKAYSQRHIKCLRSDEIVDGIIEFLRPQFRYTYRGIDDTYHKCKRLIAE